MKIDRIIGRLMGDGGRSEEKSALEAWKKEAEDNIRALEDIRKIASLSETMVGYQNFETDNAWAAFENNLKEPETSKKVTKLFSLANLSKIAAAIVLIGGSFFLYENSIQQPSKIVEIPVYAAEAEILEVGLSDGTTIVVDKYSLVTEDAEREVCLEGRAFFEVVKSEGKQFLVELPVGKVVVLGTKFSIDASNDVTEIRVDEGKVRYELGERTWILEAGDLIRVSNKDVSRINVRDDNYLSWKNQRLVFRDDNMVEVVKALSRHFKREIIIEDPKKFENCNVMDIFDNVSLETILNDLSSTHGLKYELKENKIIIYTSNC